jgi:hypothetical protein
MIDERIQIDDTAALTKIGVVGAHPEGFMGWGIFVEASPLENQNRLAKQHGRKNAGARKTDEHAASADKILQINVFLKDPEILRYSPVFSEQVIVVLAMVMRGHISRLVSIPRLYEDFIFWKKLGHVAQTGKHLLALLPSGRMAADIGIEKEVLIGNISSKDSVISRDPGSNDLPKTAARTQFLLDVFTRDKHQVTITIRHRRVSLASGAH